MAEALSLAAEAFEENEIPVGCVVVDGEGNIIGRGRNRCESGHDAVAHAEIEAIRSACASKGDWRLDDCTLFVTLEPCPMCTGAIINSRISRVCFGAAEPNSGSCGSVINLFFERYGHHPEVYGGVCEEECSDMMKKFFIEKRKKTP